MNRFRVMHVTEFQYDGPVSESYNEVHLRPRDDDRQICLSFRLSTTPPSQPSAYRDYYGNWVHRFNILAKHSHLRVEAESVVMMNEPEARAGVGSPLSELDARHSDLLEEHYELLIPSHYVLDTPRLSEWVATAEAQSDGTAGGFARATAALIHERFRYEKGATHVHSSIEDVLTNGAGVCQDFAHLLLGIARRRGLPARYVSGYLVQSAPQEEGISMEEVSGGQSSHAWAEVYIPDDGWLGLDPTQGGPVTQQHLCLAYGRDYGDVAPVRGLYKGHSGQRLSVDVRVRPALDEAGCEHLQETSAGPSPSVEEPSGQQ